MKKIYGLLAAAALVACFAGCEDYNTYEGYQLNGEEETTTEASTTAVSTTTKAKTTAKTTSAVSTSSSSSATTAEVTSAPDITKAASEYLRNGTLEDQCMEMKTKLEKAHKEFKEKANNFSDKEEAYMRVNGVTDEDMLRIQSLVYDGKTGDIVYFALSENYTPMSEDGAEDKYAKKDADGEGSADLSKLIDLKSYTQDFAGGFAIYTGTDKAFSYYSISPDMDSSKLIKIVIDHSAAAASVEKLPEKADVYRLNQYDPLLYISSAMNSSKKTV